MQKLTVNGRTIQILGIFRNPETALRCADAHPGYSNRVVMGDCDFEAEIAYYWLVTPADAQRLERAGHELVTWSDLKDPDPA